LKWIWSKFVDPIKGMLSSQSRFSRGLIAILTGTALSRIIAFAAIPLLSRLFSPSDFGVFALFGMTVSMGATLVTWRYEAAIVIAEDDNKAANLLGVTIGLTTITSLLIAAVFFVYARQIALFFGAPEFEIWLLWSPVCIWATGTFTALRLWNSRTGDFTAISIARVADTGTMVLVQTGLGLMFRGMLSGLMFGPFIGRLMAALVLFWQTMKADGDLLRQSLNFRVAVKQAKRYARFPIYDLPASVLSSGSREIPTGVLGVFFSTQWVGFYSIAFRILSVPIQVVGGAIAQVYLPVARDANEAGRLDRFTLSIFDRLMGISLAPMIMLAIVAPEITSLLLGKAWFTAGELLRYLTPSLLLAFIASPLSEVYTIFERQSEKLVFNVAVFVTRLAALIVGGLLGNAIVAVILYSVAGSVFWILQCFWLLRMCDINTITILRHIIAELAKISPLIIFVGGVQYLYNSPTKLLLALLVGLGLFGVWRWKEFLGPGVGNLTGRTS